MDLTEIINSDSFYVYALCDQNLPFYIGKGKKERLYAHERKILDESYDEFGLNKKYNLFKTRKIKKILKEGRQVEYKILFYSFDESVVFEKEKYYIKFYGRKGIDKDGILTNRTEGGCGGDCTSFLSEIKKKNRKEKLKKYWEEHPEEYKIRNEKIGKASKDRKHTKETKKSISDKQKGIKRGPSKRKGIPANGGNAKGVKQAWNKGISNDDIRYTNWSKAIQNAVDKRKGQFCGNNPFKLLAPWGEIIEGNNAQWLVREYGVSQKILSVINGKIKKCQGWMQAN